MPWEKGQSGNPAGRPPGARQKLSEQFINALAADFEAHGAQCVIDLREEALVQYMQLVAKFVPIEVEVGGKDGGNIPIEILENPAEMARRSIILLEALGIREVVERALDCQSGEEQDQESG